MNKLALKNPKLDFFVKSYFLFLSLPILLMHLGIYLTYFVGNIWGMWDDGSILGLYVISGFIAIVSHIFGILLVFVLVPIFNYRLMSGDRVPKFNRFPRLTLFVFSFLAYILTSYIIGLFLR